MVSLDDEIERLKNRRASTEGIIGHAKMRGMGKSKVKSDEATLLEGQRSIFSFKSEQIYQRFKWNGV